MKVVKFFLIICLFSIANGYARQCPKGCGTETDPRVEEIGDLIVDTLKKCELVNKPIIAVSGPDYDIYEWSGRIKLYKYYLEWKCTFDEYDSTYTFDRYFGADAKKFPDINLESEGNYRYTLHDYIETKELLSNISDDIENMHKIFIRSTEKNIEDYKKELKKYNEKDYRSSWLNQIKKTEDYYQEQL